MNKKLQVIKYLLADFFSASLAWTLFFVYRKFYIEKDIDATLGDIFSTGPNNNFYTGLFTVPFFWLFLYGISGSYKSIYRRSRLSETGQILFITLIGVIIIFFAVLLDDLIYSYKNYYQSFLSLFFIHFLCTAVCRFVLTTQTANKIHNRIIGFKTILIGANEKAAGIYAEMETQTKSSGNKFVGYVRLNNNEQDDISLHKTLPCLGNSDQLSAIIKASDAEEVILAVEANQRDLIGPILNDLDQNKVVIKIIPALYDHLSGTVKMTSIFGAPLIEISRTIMPEWQYFVKRCFDIFISVMVLVLFSWLYVLLAIIIKITSKGPVFYSHERIGIHGKPFMMYKFRSMLMDAEKNGPALSSKNDSRITPFGRFLRKVRLDEIPQFFNVLIGDMSIVGPRPERKYFIDQIMQKAPHYRYLHKVKPGITSWGQVKFGYAENVDEMVERLKYDLLYIENMSLIVDFKILIYTILIVMQGRGK